MEFLGKWLVIIKLHVTDKYMFPFLTDVSLICFFPLLSFPFPFFASSSSFFSFSLQEGDVNLSQSVHTHTVPREGRVNHPYELETCVRVHRGCVGPFRLVLIN